MKLRDLLKGWLGAKQSAIPARRARTRLHLESLEERVNPVGDNLYSNLGGDYVWSDAANWNNTTENTDTHVPTATDSVFFNSALAGPPATPYIAVGTGADSVVDSGYNVNDFTDDPSYGGTLWFPTGTSLSSSNAVTHYGTMVLPPDGEAGINASGDYTLEPTGTIIPNESSPLAITAGAFNQDGNITLVNGAAMTINANIFLDQANSSIYVGPGGYLSITSSAGIDVSGSIVNAGGTLIITAPFVRVWPTGTLAGAAYDSAFPLPPLPSGGDTLSAIHVFENGLVTTAPTGGFTVGAAVANAANGVSVVPSLPSYPPPIGGDIAEPKILLVGNLQVQAGAQVTTADPYQFDVTGNIDNQGDVSLVGTDATIGGSLTLTNGSLEEKPNLAQQSLSYIDGYSTNVVVIGAINANPTSSISITDSNLNTGDALNLRSSSLTTNAVITGCIITTSSDLNLDFLSSITVVNPMYMGTSTLNIGGSLINRGTISMEQSSIAINGAVTVNDSNDLAHSTIAMEDCVVTVGGSITVSPDSTVTMGVCYVTAGPLTINPNSEVTMADCSLILGGMLSLNPPLPGQSLPILNLADDPNITPEPYLNAPWGIYFGGTFITASAIINDGGTVSITSVETTINADIINSGSVTAAFPNNIEIYGVNLVIRGNVTNSGSFTIWGGMQMGDFTNSGTFRIGGIWYIFGNFTQTTGILELPDPINAGPSLEVLGLGTVASLGGVLQIDPVLPYPGFAYDDVPIYATAGTGDFQGASGTGGWVGVPDTVDHVMKYWLQGP
jgi:hypothetical protein